VVYRLQTRIFRASERGNVQAVHSLQRLLMKSEAARCLAVRRVTQDNWGKNTAGMDGVKAVPPVQRSRLVALLGQPDAIKPRPTRRGQIRSDRSRFAAYGLAGGGPGRRSRNVLNPGPHERLLPPRTTLEVTCGDELRHELAGAGGWGDPLERDPQLVLADVCNDKVTPEHARSAYGVILDPGGTCFNEAETAQLREQLRRLD
jgi:reverse transcriptase-like protein/hydantoinase/oxoprolinase-like protein